MGAQKTADYIKPTRGSALFCLHKQGSFKRLLIGYGADSHVGAFCSALNWRPLLPDFFTIHFLESFR